jgi:hypothetical protein
LEFGTAVAVSGDTIAVGAPGEDSSATGIDGYQYLDYATKSGAVYVFTRADGTWTQKAYVKASNTRPPFMGNPDGAMFGSAVALDQDTLAVGAPGERSGAVGVEADQADLSAPGAGAVYVFTRSSGVWSQQAYIKASKPRSGAGFGTALSLTGDTLVVAAEGDASKAIGIDGSGSDTSAQLSGAVYVFQRSGGLWRQQAYVKASNTQAQARFGSAVALDGDGLAVGAIGEASAATGIGGDTASISAPSAGAVYFFARIGATWAQRSYVKATNTRRDAFFGSAVGLAGTTLVVGSTGESSSATGISGNALDTTMANAGAAYVY